MSFRKRNVVVSNSNSLLPSQPQQVKQSIPGTRPSPLDGRLTISTGTRSLDTLLAGHAGLPLGNSILIEENGTTDFGGTLLKYYAAEGITQGHHVHVLGMNEGWGRDLPGLATGGEGKEKEDEKEKERMKIAWRYERLGEAGVRERNGPQTTTSSSGTTQIFCHDFDLSKRLILPSPSNLFFIPTQGPPTFDFSPSLNTTNPFTAFLTHLQSHLQNTPPTQVHRIIIPSLLSPAFYPHTTSSPTIIIQFLHALRALLRLHPARLTALLTLPLSLYPRTTGLTRMIEVLSDSVITLSPFPSTAIIPPKAPIGSAAAKEEPPQGMCEIHRLPVFHERGGGSGGNSEGGDDFAFSLSRKKGLVIRPFSLPPVEGDQEAQEGGGGGKGLESEVGKVVSKGDLEF